MKRAIVDVDGTLWDLHKPLHLVLHTLYPDLPKEPVREWDWYKEHITDSQFYAVVNIIHRLQIADNAEPFVGAEQLFNRLHANKYEIFVASHRKYDTGHLLARWLVRNRLTPFSAVYTGNDKTEFIREGDLVIDDAPKTIEYSLNIGAEVWYIAWPWNEGLGGNRRETLWEIIAGLA